MRQTFFIFFFFLAVTYSFAQEKSAFEFYGGPSQAFFPTEVFPSNDYLITSNPLSWHIGIGYLKNLGTNWQLNAQLEFFKRHLGSGTRASFVQDTVVITGYSTDGLPLIALGARYNFHGLKTAYFIQPGLSVIKSPEFLNQYGIGNKGSFEGFPLGLKSLNDIGFGIRVEGGMKIYNQRRNYFLIGLRYQKGLRVMDQMNAPVFYNGDLSHVIVAKSRGTYLGLFAGYGINGSSWGKGERELPRRFYNEKMLQNHELAMEDGWYFMLYGGGRRKEEFKKNDYGYSNSSGQFQAVVGFTRNQFSFETGYGNFSANNNYQFDYEGYKPLFMNWYHYSIPVIPLTFKYHLPLNESQTFRIGSSFSGFLVLKDQSQNQFWTSPGSGGSIIVDNKTYQYTGIEFSDPEYDHGRIFFNAGLFAEMLVFNSSFLTLKVSRNFSSPDFSRIYVEYIIDGTEFKFLSTSGLNGYLLDVGFKLPLKLLNKKDKTVGKI